ncbi:MAG: hypothetical protein KDJ99_30340 [Candidatus Competibacteraceae bacterium]|nr:hypothetical protein [Candidatus Competibacteraceae bacterium]
MQAKESLSHQEVSSSISIKYSKNQERQASEGFKQSRLTDTYRLKYTPSSTSPPPLPVNREQLRDVDNFLDSLQKNNDETISLRKRNIIARKEPVSKEEQEKQEVERVKQEILAAHVEREKREEWLTITPEKKALVQIYDLIQDGLEKGQHTLKANCDKAQTLMREIGIDALAAQKYRLPSDDLPTEPPSTCPKEYQGKEKDGDPLVFLWENYRKPLTDGVLSQKILRGERKKSGGKKGIDHSLWLRLWKDYGSDLATYLPSDFTLRSGKSKNTHYR